MIECNSVLVQFASSQKECRCIIQGDRREPDVFEMISTHLFFNEKAILLQKNLRNYMPFELHIMNER